MNILSINNLSVSTDNKRILSDVSFTANQGEVHALLGPNGSGKSTLAQTIAGHPDHQIVEGELYFLGKNINEMAADARAREGIFLAFQNPVSLPGVELFSFLRASFMAIYPAEDIDIEQFKNLVYQVLDQVGLNHSFAYRNVNEGFSGGERKRLEVAQAILLRPRLLILDEVDSGLDVDALKLIGHALQNFKKNSPQSTIIIITHHHKLFTYLPPTQIHLLSQGRCQTSIDQQLLSRIEKHGYDQKGT